jgi:hypothetical protein
LLRIKGLWIGWALGLSANCFILIIRLAIIDWMKSAKKILIIKEDIK